MKISVVTAVFNRSETIEQALRSVSEQSYSEVEHLIIDGGSTDGTLQKILKHNNKALRLVSEPDDGIYDALNKGIDLASGDVVGVMHSDDFFASKHVLAKVASAFGDPRVDAVYGDLDYISASDSNRIIRRWRSSSFSRQQLLRGWMPPHPTLFLRRSVFQRFGKYNTSYRIAADYEAILRYFGDGNVSSVYIPEVLVKMRVGGESNKSLGRIIRKTKEDYRALRSNGLGGFSAVFFKNFGKVGQFVKR